MPRWGGTLEEQQSVVSNKNKSPESVKSPENKKYVESSYNVDDQTKSLKDDSDKFTLQYVKSFTPRSNEAMKREGVLPREIVKRNLAYFQSRIREDQPAELAQIRYNHYISKKKQLIKDLRKTRQQLIQAGWTPPILQSPVKSLKHSKSASFISTPRAKMQSASLKSSPGKHNIDNDLTFPGLEFLAHDEKYANAIEKV